jgi:hypothetical protein
MQLIARQELTSAAASITFSSIPATFTDLVLVLSLRVSAGGDGNIARCALKMNAVTSGYSSRMLFGNGSSASSASDTTTQGFTWFYANGFSATASTFGSSQIYLPNYGSSVAKSASIDSVTENNATAAIESIAAALCTSTEAITSLTLTQTESGNFVSGSSASLFGVLAGTDGIVTVS